MRFAVKTRPEHQSWDELRDIWVAADEVPLFESIWNWDHFYPLTGDLPGPNFEGWTMLSAMAALTPRIRVGCQVTGMPYRHPAVLANMAATVDHISAGRLILGIGAAWNEMECTAYGFPLPPLKERFDRFDEGIEVITRAAVVAGVQLLRRVLHADRRALRAQAGAAALPADHHRRQRAQAHAARRCPLGDGVERHVQDPARFTELKEILRGHCADIGRDFAEITCSCLVRWDGSDYDALLASLAAVARRGRRPGRHRPADARQARVAVRARRGARLTRVASGTGGRR